MSAMQAALMKYLAQSPKAAKALEFAKANKGLLGGAAAAGGVAVAAPAIQHGYDDFMTDRALASVGRNVKRAAGDAADYAEEHPIAASALLGGSALAGYRAGRDPDDMVENAPNLIDAVLKARLQYKQRQQGG
jgi:hypothetical protein